ncbi:TPA: hypothetical protein L9199_004811 [Klebsiella aerogenes]|nr:hypothetical protein [Klebsiella aerogenes]
MVQGGGLKMLIEVVCTSFVYPGNTLNPIQNAMYLVNGDIKSVLKVVAANPFTERRWRKWQKSSVVMSGQKAKV